MDIINIIKKWHNDKEKYVSYRDTETWLYNDYGDRCVLKRYSIDDDINCFSIDIVEQFEIENGDWEDGLWHYIGTYPINKVEEILSDELMLKLYEQMVKILKVEY